jgi:hypothetical protein
LKFSRENEFGSGLAITQALIQLGLQALGVFLVILPRIGGVLAVAGRLTLFGCGEKSALLEVGVKP